jgi:hypothetical protein
VAALVEAAQPRALLSHSTHPNAGKRGVRVGTQRAVRVRHPEIEDRKWKKLRRGKPLEAE